MRGIIVLLTLALVPLSPADSASAAWWQAAGPVATDNSGPTTVTTRIRPDRRSVVAAPGGYALIVPKGAVRRRTRARIRVRPPINGVVPRMDAHISGKWRGKVVVQLPFTGAKGDGALLTHYSADGVRVTSGRDARVVRLKRQWVVRAGVTSLSQVSAGSITCPTDPKQKDAIFVCRNQQDQSVTDWWEDTLPRLRGSEMLAIPVVDTRCATSTPGLQVPVIRTIALFSCTLDYDSQGWTLQIDLRSISSTSSWTFGPYLLTGGPAPAESAGDSWISRLVRTCPRCNILVRPGSSVTTHWAPNEDISMVMAVEKYALASESAIGDMLQFVDPEFLAAAESSEDFSFGLQRCQVGTTASDGPGRAECVADALNSVLLDVISGRDVDLSAMKEQATVARELMKSLDMGAYVAAFDRARRDWPAGPGQDQDQLVMTLEVARP